MRSKKKRGEWLTTKEITIEYQGKEEKVVVKRLTWGERNEVIRQAMGKIRVLGGDTPQLEYDQITFMEQFTLRSLVSAPFKIDIAEIKNLDPAIADKIYKAAFELNSDLFRDLF